MRLAHLYTASGEFVAIAEFPFAIDRLPLFIQIGDRRFVRYGDSTTDLYHETVDPRLVVLVKRA